MLTRTMNPNHTGIDMFDIREDNQVESLQELVADYDGIIHEQSKALREKDDLIRELENNRAKTLEAKTLEAKTYWYNRTMALAEEIDDLKQWHDKVVKVNHKLDKIHECLGEWSTTALPLLKHASKLVPSLLGVTNFVAKINEGWTCSDGKFPWQ